MPFNPHPIQRGRHCPNFLRGRNRYRGSERLIRAGEWCRESRALPATMAGLTSSAFGPRHEAGVQGAKAASNTAGAHGSTRPLLACLIFYHHPHRRLQPSSHCAGLRTARFGEDTEWSARHNRQCVGRHGSCPTSVTQSLLDLFIPVFLVVQQGGQTKVLSSSDHRGFQSFSVWLLMVESRQLCHLMPFHHPLKRAACDFPS